MRYFRKELPEMPFYASSGAKIQVEFFDPNGLGYIATDNPLLTHDLEIAIARHKGGVEETTEAEYLEFIKKKDGKELPKFWKRGQTEVGLIPSPGQLFRSRRKSQDAAVAPDGQSNGSRRERPGSPSAFDNSTTFARAGSPTKGGSPPPLEVPIHFPKLGHP